MRTPSALRTGAPLLLAALAACSSDAVTGARPLPAEPLLYRDVTQYVAGPSNMLLYFPGCDNPRQSGAPGWECYEYSAWPDTKVTAPAELHAQTFAPAKDMTVGFIGLPVRCYNSKLRIQVRSGGPTGRTMSDDIIGVPPWIDQTTFFLAPVGKDPGVFLAAGRTYAIVISAYAPLPTSSTYCGLTQSQPGLDPVKGAHYHFDLTAPQWGWIRDGVSKYASDDLPFNTYILP